MRSGLVGLLLATGGCLVLNPAYGGDEGGGGFGSTSGQPTSGVDASSTGSSGDAGSVGGTAAVEESTGFEGTGMVATTATGSTGDDTTTTAVEPGMAVIPADIATCVLQPFMVLPYQGPEQCEFLVTVELVQDPAQRDGLIIDKQFDDAQGRPAWGVLRFDLSQVPDGATITAASLALTVSASPYQNFGVGASGRLRSAAPFDAMTLAVGPPVVGPGDVPIGATNPGELKVLDVTALVGPPGMSAAHLVIEPEDANGRIYMNKTSDAPPTLTVSWQ